MKNNVLTFLMVFSLLQPLKKLSLNAPLDRPLANESRVVFFDSDLRGSKLFGASFYNARFDQVNLSNSDLRAAHFTEVVFENVAFEEAQLQNAKFNNVTFDRVRFGKTDLESTTFFNCRFLNMDSPL